MTNILFNKSEGVEFCEICGKEFNGASVENDFHGIVISTVFPLRYSAFGRKLCPECAKSEYENGNYYEVCEVCGKTFYPETERVEFDRLLSIKRIEADIWEWGIHCTGCAESILLKYISEKLKCKLRLI